MKLAAVQYCPPHGNPELARDELRGLLMKAEGADLIVCPEMALSGYVWSSREEIAPFVEAAAGPSFEMLRQCAIKLQATIVCGIAEVAGDTLYNSAITVSAEGALVSCYRKNLLFEQDETWAQPGRERALLQVPRVGLLCPAICMDLNDDEFALYIHQNRPEVIAFCTNWIEEGVDILPYWRMRLFGWQGYMVVADRWGSERGTQFYGRSTVLGPDNAILGTLPAEGNAVLWVDTETLITDVR